MAEDIRDGSDYEPEELILLHLTHELAGAMGEYLVKEWPDEARTTLQDLSHSEAVLAEIVIGGYRYTIDLVVTRHEDDRHDGPFQIKDKLADE